MTTAPLIHVVDDDSSMRTALLLLLREVGFEARGYSSTGEFLLQPLPDRLGCLLLDLRLPGPSGLDLQAALQQQNVTLPIVFLSGEGDIPTTVQAMRSGAEDFLTKTAPRDQLLAAIERALARDAEQRKQRDHLALLRRRFQARAAHFDASATWLRHPAEA